MGTQIVQSKLLKAEQSVACTDFKTLKNQTVCLWLSPATCNVTEAKPYIELVF